MQKQTLWKTSILFAGFFGLAVACQAGWTDWLPQKSSSSNTPSLAGATTSVTETEMVRGLKEALSKGVSHAVSQLGKDGGFLNNAEVKIPMPEKIQSVERTLRMLGQGAKVDEFVATMNHAAEKAVPEAAAVFAGAITNMTVADAKSTVSGPPDAATQYFRKTGEASLAQKTLPIIKAATEHVGVTASYKNLVQSAGPAAQLLGKDAGDIDGYINQKALDGVFKMIAAEEKQIRENPAARTTDLLKHVFGNFGK
jgi:hypothetical protein